MPLRLTKSSRVHPTVHPTHVPDATDFDTVSLRASPLIRPVNPWSRIEVYVKGPGLLGLTLGIDPLTGTPIVVAAPAADGEVELARPGAVQAGDRMYAAGSRVFEDFQDLDADHDGTLSKSEVKAAMRRLGCNADALVPSVLLHRLGDTRAAEVAARTLVAAEGAAGRLIVGRGASGDSSIDAGAAVVSAGVPLEEFKAAMNDAVTQDLADQLARERRPVRLVFLRYGASQSADGAPSTDALTPPLETQVAKIASEDAVKPPGVEDLSPLPSSGLLTTADAVDAASAAAAP